MNKSLALRPSVVLVLPYGVLGAAEDYIMILADGLSDRGWDVSVLGPKSTAIDSVREDPHWEATVVNDEVLVSPVALRRQLQLLQPDVVHVNQVALPAMAAAALLRRTPLIVTAHNPALANHYNLKGRVLGRVVRRRPRAWIVLSDRNRLLLERERVRPTSIHVVPPGLPPRRFETPLRRSGARASLGVPTEAFVVGTVGRLSRQKRHDLLIQALSRLTDQMPTMHLVILGDGELREETKKLAADLLPGRVTLTGHRVDVPQILGALDMFALSSDFEGLPFALLEAMATGLPIVTTDVQGAGEAIRHEREGLLVPPGEPDTLAAAIFRLASDRHLALALGDAAKKRFLRDYTADRMVARTEMLYKTLLDPRKRSTLGSISRRRMP